MLTNEIIQELNTRGCSINCTWEKPTASSEYVDFCVTI